MHPSNPAREGLPAEMGQHRRRGPDRLRAGLRLAGRPTHGGGGARGARARGARAGSAPDGATCWPPTRSPRVVLVGLRAAPSRRACGASAQHATAQLTNVCAARDKSPWALAPATSASTLQTYKRVAPPPPLSRLPPAPVSVPLATVRHRRPATWGAAFHFADTTDTRGRRDAAGLVGVQRRRSSERQSPCGTWRTGRSGVRVWHGSWIDRVAEIGNDGDQSL